MLLWWLLTDSNCGHKALQASALPTELRSHDLCGKILITLTPKPTLNGRLSDCIIGSELRSHVSLERELYHLSDISRVLLCRSNINSTWWARRGYPSDALRPVLEASFCALPRLRTLCFAIIGFSQNHTPIIKSTLWRVLFLVGEAGVEPACRKARILSPLCIPIPPLALVRNPF